LSLSSNSDVERSSHGAMRTPAAIPAGDPFASFDQYRTVPRQRASGQGNGIQSFGTPDLYADASNKQLVYAVNGIPQVVFGNHQYLGSGVFIAPSGADATAATSNSQLLFSSAPTVVTIPFMIGWVAHGASTSGVDTNTFSAPHGLKSAPAVIAYYDTATNAKTLLNDSYTTAFTSIANGVFNARLTVTSSQIVVTMSQSWWTGAAGAIPAFNLTGNITCFIQPHTG
jgi:hypothetical protein